MNYNRVISDYYTQKDIITFFKNIAGEWWEELRQDVFLTICEYDQTKIIDMHERKCLKFFIVRIGLNQFRSKNSKSLPNVLFKIDPCKLPGSIFNFFLLSYSKPK